MTEVRIIDVTDGDAFRLVPPCADRRFDHRTCDYWEDVDRGSAPAAFVPGLRGRRLYLGPVRPARLAITATSSAGWTGLGTWIWYPARSARMRSSGRA